MAKSIKLTRTYPHPISEVWRAITDENAMSQWLMPCDFKAELGYKFKFTTKPGPGFDGIVNCEVISLEEPNLLEFTWSGGNLKNTKVSFNLSKVSEGQTQLDFEHSGFEGFVNNLIVKRILANGWKGKILKVQLPNFLANG